MFQITIIDSSRAKVISPPEKLKIILAGREYIKPEIIPSIQTAFPLVTVAHLSYKTEVKKYKRSRPSVKKKYNPSPAIKHMIEYLETQTLTDYEKSFLVRVKDYLYETGGMLKSMYSYLSKIYSTYKYKE